MTRTFEEMAAERDPLYAATKPRGDFEVARVLDEDAAESQKLGMTGFTRLWLFRDAFLGRIAIRALRNQGQPYYDRQP